MRLLFIDDSHQKNYLGYGGFCIAESDLAGLKTDLAKLKGDFGIPETVELKWSPDPKHFLRTRFTGERHDLYRTCIALLKKYDTPVICAVHDLSSCYGRSLHNWDMNRTILWATQGQVKYLAERFETPYLSLNDDRGIIISDQYGDRKGESTLVEDVSEALKKGTQFRQFERICMPPLMTYSRYSPPLELADIVVGVIVSALADNRYGRELFPEVAVLLLRNPNEGSLSFASVLSVAVLGYGLILFPSTCRSEAVKLFKDLDKKYVYTKQGLKDRSIR